MPPTYTTLVYSLTAASSPMETSPYQDAKRGAYYSNDGKESMHNPFIFSTNAVPVDEAQDSGDDGFQLGIDPKSEPTSNYEAFQVTQPDVTEQEKALVEGRRSIIRELPTDTTVEEGAPTTTREHIEGYIANGTVKAEGAIQEKMREISDVMPPQNVRAAPPVNWNAVNATKIRTTLGGSVGKVKTLVDKLNLAKDARKEAEEHPNRDLSESISLFTSTAAISCKTLTCLFRSHFIGTGKSKGAPHSPFYHGSRRRSRICVQISTARASRCRRRLQLLPALSCERMFQTPSSLKCTEIPAKRGRWHRAFFAHMEYDRAMHEEGDPTRFERGTNTCE